MSFPFIIQLVYQIWDKIYIKQLSLTVNYLCKKGKLKNGKIFDTSKQRKEPLTFEIGARKVIPGMEIGVMGMCIG